MKSCYMYMQVYYRSSLQKHLILVIYSVSIQTFEIHSFPLFLAFSPFFHVTSPHIFMIFCSDVIDNFSSYQTFLKQFCHIPLIIFIKHICGIFIFIIIFFQKINRLNLILCACPNVETVKIKPSKCVSLLYTTADKKKMHCFWLICLPFSKY